MKLKWPCVKECEKRTAECKKTCPDWQKYEKEYFDDLKKRDSERLANEAYFLHKSEVIAQSKSRTRRKK